MSHYIVHGRAEFETTDLGLAAYEGRTEDVRMFLERGIDWTAEGQQPLAALYAGHVRGASLPRFQERALRPAYRRLVAALPDPPRRLAQAVLSVAALSASFEPDVIVATLPSTRRAHGRQAV